MPIYAYKCAACGHAKDVLQKVSDEPLTICPACGAAAFGKQVTAAGFQLKGSGWYATDFRGGTSAPAADKTESSDKSNQAGKADKANDSKPADAGKSGDATPASTKPDAPSACAGGRGASRARA